MSWVQGRQGQGQGPRLGPRHVVVSGANRGYHMMVWIMCRAKGMGPDARGQQAWSQGNARCIGRHGPSVEWTETNREAKRLNKPVDFVAQYIHTEQVRALST